MKNYMNFEMLSWYSMFATFFDAHKYKFGGFWDGRLMHYIIMATLAYLVVGIVWWIVKHWKEESRWHRFMLLIWLFGDSLFLVMDILGKN